MKKSKIFKKLLSSILAGTTVFQMNFSYVGAVSRPKESQSLPVILSAIFNVSTIAALTGGLIYQSNELQRKNQELTSKTRHRGKDTINSEECLQPLLQCEQKIKEIILHIEDTQECIEGKYNYMYQEYERVFFDRNQLAWNILAPNCENIFEGSDMQQSSAKLLQYIPKGEDGKEVTKINANHIHSFLSFIEYYTFFHRYYEKTQPSPNKLDRLKACITDEFKERLEVNEIIKNPTEFLDCVDKLIKQLKNKYTNYQSNTDNDIIATFLDDMLRNLNEWREIFGIKKF